MRKLLFSLFLLSLGVIFPYPAFAGGGLVSFEVTPSYTLNPGEQYIVRPTVHLNDNSFCKQCPISIKLQNPQASDYIAQSDSKTDDNGTMYAKVISKAPGNRIVYAVVTLPDGTNYTSSVYILNYYGNPSEITPVVGGPYPSIGGPTPYAKQSGINWATNVVLFKAGNFSLMLNGEEYGRNIALVSLDSQPNNPNVTTIEAKWQEKGADISFNMYFTYNGQFWKVSDMRSYSSKNPGNWTYYKVTDGNGNFLQNVLGQAYINNAGLLTFKSVDGKSAIRMENIYLQAFLNQPYPLVTPILSGTQNQDVDQLNNRINNLEDQLAQSQKKQSALEVTINNLVNFIRSLFPFFKNS